MSKAFNYDQLFKGFIDCNFKLQFKKDINSLGFHKVNFSK